MRAHICACSALIQTKAHKITTSPFFSLNRGERVGERGDERGVTLLIVRADLKAIGGVQTARVCLNRMPIPCSRRTHVQRSLRRVQERRGGGMDRKKERDGIATWRGLRARRRTERAEGGGCDYGSRECVHV